MNLEWSYIPFKKCSLIFKAVIIFEMEEACMIMGVKATCD